MARAVDWLMANQTDTGAFRCYASDLRTTPSWEEDEVNFVTALASMALVDVHDDLVVTMRSRAARLLRSERERAQLWRHWCSGSALHGYTPLDVDDTACCSLALGLDPRRSNGRLLLDNRDRRGRFFTWLLPRPEIRSARHRWRLREENRPVVRARRRALWADSEASPDDVDVVVNANVIRYLGPRLAPAGAVQWVIDVIRQGTEVQSDRWYRSRTSLYRSVAAACRRGVSAFSDVRGTIIRRLAEDPGPDALRGDLEFADALQVLLDLDAPSAVVREFRGLLLDRQLDDGSWTRSLCYFGGPQESFGWASEALATAASVGALTRAR